MVTLEDSVRVDDLKPHNTAPLSTSELGNMDVTGGVPSIQTTHPTPPISSPSSIASPNSLSTNNPDAQLETDMSDTTESEADKVSGMVFDKFKQQLYFNLSTNLFIVCMSIFSDLIGISGGSGQCSSSHEGRQMLRVVLPISVDQLFTLLFTNSKFFVDFHISRNSSSKNISNSIAA